MSPAAVKALMWEISAGGQVVKQNAGSGRLSNMNNLGLQRMSALMIG